MEEKRTPTQGNPTPGDTTWLYERQLAIERERRQRVERLEPLLSTIAEALDIREIFPKLSDVIQPVIAHATVSLALLTPDGQGVKIHVASNFDVGELPVYRFTSDQEAIGAGWRSFIGYDCTLLEEGVTRVQTSAPGVEPLTHVDLRPGAPWTSLLARLRIRSLLRVPVRVKARAVGAISFGADKLSEDARDRLVRHSWPGNVRELRNAIERAVILCEGGLVTGDHLPITVAPAKPAAATGIALSGQSQTLKLSVAERDLIEKALANARNNKSQAAKLLGIPRGQFYSLLRKHGLTNARR